MQSPSEGVKLQSPARQQFPTWFLVFATSVCICITIFIAYNGSLDQPLSRKLTFETPERSITCLNILSHVSMFFLAELLSCVFEKIRWALACSEIGTSAYTFLALSRATNVIGVASLLLARTPGSLFKFANGVRVWGSQRFFCKFMFANRRLFFTLLRCAMGILLLSDISFRSIYPSVKQFPILRAGLSSLNVSLVNTAEFNLSATADFWWYFPALLSDSQRVAGVPPISCSGESCHSYFLPGSMATIILDPQVPAITPDTYPNAIAYIQNDAPGYQIDYYPIDPDTDPPLDLNDCHIYGLNNLALQVCLKSSGSSLLAGKFTPMQSLQKGGAHVLGL